MREFIPDQFRWETYDDLKEKIIQIMEGEQASASWTIKRQQLWEKISVLTPETFQNNIWSQMKQHLKELSGR
jgi:hypothetical protein